MRCLLISFFNSDNLGDLVIASNLYDFVEQKFHTEKVSYATSSPFHFSNINEMHFTRKKSQKLRIKSLLYRVMVNFQLEKYWDRRKEKNKSQIDFKIEEKVKSSDIVIIGGGNMMFDVSSYSRSAKTFKKFIDMAKKYNKKVFVISIGIGPFVTELQEKQAVTELNRCDYITFRDKKSFGIYKKYYNDKKSFLTVDPAFLLKQSIDDGKNNFNENHVVGLNLFNNKTADENSNKYKKVLKGYLKLLNALLQKSNTKVILFSTDLNDYPMINEIGKEFPADRLEIREIKGFNELMGLYNEIDILIGCRMHSLILAYTQQLPVIGLSWQPKVDALFDIIEQPESVFRYDNIEENLQQILNCYSSKLLNLVDEKEKIQKRIVEIREQFDVNEEIIGKLIYTNNENNNKAKVINHKTING
jgi:polysaccharide pyruvyl transferase WcaK-like protein